MRWIDIDDHTVRVDDDGPEPLPSLAHWLKDSDPPIEEIGILLSTGSLAISLIDDCAGQIADVVDTAFGIVCYYLGGYDIAPTKYVSATGRALTASSGSVTVTQN